MKVKPMNKRQLEIQKLSAEEETKVIHQLKLVYGQAQDDCINKIIELSKRTDMENLQTIIYQKRYQEAIKKQLDSILENLQTKEFHSISDYLNVSYENGFFGTLYDLQGQGIPLCFPIDQEQVIQAVQTDTKLSNGLYNKLGEDTEKMKKSIKVEISRGIANGESWNQAARYIAIGMNNPFKKSYNNAIRIARTEGHRIQNQATLHCQQRAKDKGADVVKQWDSTLDGDTRLHHQQLNGQIREVEEQFEVAGKKAIYPGGFGDPSEDCNCRCCLLQRARWALEDEKEYTKWDGDKNELVTIKAKSYNDFREQTKALNETRDYKIVNNQRGNFAVKERVTFLEALGEMSPKVKQALENVTISVGSNGSGFRPTANTIYVGKNASKYEIIHEIGHAIEDKLFDKDKVNFMKEQCVKGLTVKDIVVKVGVDSSGNQTKVLVINSDKLIDKYQGRLYVSVPSEAINENGAIAVEHMEEFISVAVQKYHENPAALKKKNYDIFTLVEGALQ